MALPPLLVDADNALVRSAIRVDLTTEDLSDAAVAGARSTAISQVVAIEPQAGTWPDGSDEATRDHDAAVLLAAAYLLPSLPQVTRENFTGYSYAVTLPDPAERAEQLRAQAYALLYQNLGLDPVESLRPTVAMRGPGGRGDVSDRCWPWGWRVGLHPPV